MIPFTREVRFATVAVAILASSCAPGWGPVSPPSTRFANVIKVNSYPYSDDIFVADRNTSGAGSIRIYGGSNSPVVVIHGSSTEISNPLSIAVNGQGKIWLSNLGSPIGGTNVTGYVLRFAPNASGDATPAATLYTLMNSGPPWAVGINNSGDLVVGDEANYLSNPIGIVATFSPGAHDLQAPIRYFEDYGTLSNPYGLAFDAVDNYYVTNGFYFNSSGPPSLMAFAEDTNGYYQAPFATLKSPATSGTVDWFATGVAVDETGPICRTLLAGGWFVGSGGSGQWTDYQGRIMWWFECPPSGRSNPDGYISYSGLKQPNAIALDPGGNIYVADLKANAVFEFSKDASGSSVPVRTISGNVPAGVTLGPFYGSSERRR